MDSVLYGIFQVKMVAKNILLGSPWTCFVHVGVKTIITVGSVTVLLLNSIEIGILVVIFLIEIFVLISFQVFSILFQLFSNYLVHVMNLHTLFQ